MPGYEISFSITAVCPCCGKDLPSSSYLTVSKPSGYPLDRDNPYERKDRRVFITPCADCFEPKRKPDATAGVEGTPASLSDERILHLWDTHVAYETNPNRPRQPPLSDKDKLAFARAVLSAHDAPEAMGALQEAANLARVIGGMLAEANVPTDVKGKVHELRRMLFDAALGVKAYDEARLAEWLKAAGYMPEPEGFLWVFSTSDLVDIVNNIAPVSGVKTPNGGQDAEG